MMCTSRMPITVVPEKFAAVAAKIIVVPAKAGTHSHSAIERARSMGPRLRGDDGRMALAGWP
jgi:hypothetical protein